MSLSLREKIGLYNGELPLERASSIPSMWYVDDDIYLAERRAVLGSHWHLACGVRDFDGTGSFVTARIMGEPILIAKDNEQAFRAFSNVCRHRGAIVSRAACGKVDTFRCAHHGWEYDLRGRLLNAPNFEGVADFYREEHGLPALKVDTWAGFVFIHLHSSPTPLLESLYSAASRLSDLGLEHYEPLTRQAVEWNCNWKLVVDAHLDEERQADRLQSLYPTPLRETRLPTEISRDSVFQIVPVPEGRVYHVWVYPHFMLTVHPKWMVAATLSPLSSTKTVITLETFAAPKYEENETVRNSLFQLLSGNLAKDQAICEERQMTLQSRYFASGRFSFHREAGAHHFHHLLAQDLQALTTPN